jgi:curli production assembly/transport component CsgF
MIGSAESQNKFKDKQVERNELTELQQFTQDLNSQLLNSVSRSLFTQQFGNDGISVGSYTLVVYPLRFILLQEG